MLCINNPYTDIYFNLAAEEYLLKHFDKDVFILWQSEPSVVVGKHQNIGSEVNIDFIKENSIKAARRISGGGAVYHDLGNLNFTFIERTNHPSFEKYPFWMSEFLSTLGVKATIDERRSLYIDGLKISGSAQYIYKDKTIYHATFLFSSNLSILKTTLDSKYDATLNEKEVKPYRNIRSVKSPVTNICNILPSPIHLNDFKIAAFNYFKSQNEDSSIYFFNSFDIKAIEQIKMEKYATDKWIFNL